MTQPPIHRRHVTCHRHPTKPVTGFCASCLRERLSGIDPDTHIETPLTRLSSELRRSKSHSSSSSSAAAAQPRRRSCDVRMRNTLSDLFHVENSKGQVSKGQVKFKGLGFDLGVEIGEIGGEIRVSREEGFDGDGEFRTMKEFIDLEWEEKKGNSFVGRGFWEVASSISRKLGKWKIKEKKGNVVKDKDVGKVENEERRSFGGFGRVGKLRETQSEVGDYGFGRRSCDTDPRLSVDACVGVRLSVDDSRWSFEEPRASLDGCLIGNGRMYHQHSKLVPPPLVSVMEDVKVGGKEGLEEKEGSVGLENGGNESCCPGGTMQTRDYYYSGRRRSFDRSMSVKRVGLGEDELKSMWNAKVSPETVGLFHGAKLLVTEKELRNSNWYADKDSRGGSVDSVSKDIGSVAVGTSEKDMGLKRTQGWHRVWNVWGLMQRKRDVKCGDEESSVGGNVIDGPIEESLQKLRGIANGMRNGAVSQKLIRSYTVSTRDSGKMACTGGSGIDSKDNSSKRKEEIMLQRSRSIRYSPNNVDNGLLRFYLTPQRSYGRSRSGKNRLNSSLPLARDVL